MTTKINAAPIAARHFALLAARGGARSPATHLALVAAAAFALWLRPLTPEMVGGLANFFVLSTASIPMTLALTVRARRSAPAGAECLAAAGAHLLYALLCACVAAPVLWYAAARPGSAPAAAAVGALAANHLLTLLAVLTELYAAGEAEFTRLRGGGGTAP